MNAQLPLLANVTATIFLAGLVWFLQTVHLPLLLRIGGIEFAGYVKAQRIRNTLLMALPMAIELITAAWLLITPLPHRNVFHAFVLVAIIWIVTLGWIVPLNSRLARGYDGATVQALIRRNWIRTGCWTLRAGIMIWIMAGRLRV